MFERKTEYVQNYSNDLTNSDICLKQTMQTVESYILLQDFSHVMLKSILYE